MLGSHIQQIPATKVECNPIYFMKPLVIPNSCSSNDLFHLVLQIYYLMCCLCAMEVKSYFTPWILYLPIPNCSDCICYYKSVIFFSPLLFAKTGFERYQRHR